MKKLLTSSFIISSMVLSPALRALDAPIDHENAPVNEQVVDDSEDQGISLDEASIEPDQDIDNASDEDNSTGPTDGDTENEGTPVGQAANEGISAAKKKRWQNIALAVGAVAVAVTALILVANNDGHKDHSHSKK